MSFNGAKDGKHYWLTPEDLMAELQAEFDFDFDPCPYPKPADFDGLTAEWGQSNYVNPPFGAIVYEDGKKRGATAWARKCIEEFKKGKKVVMVYPIDKWVLMLLDAGAKVRNLKDVQWVSTEDKQAHKGTGRHIAMFILDPDPARSRLLDAVKAEYEHMIEKYGSYEMALAYCESNDGFPEEIMRAYHETIKE